MRAGLALLSIFLALPALAQEPLPCLVWGPERTLVAEPADNADLYQWRAGGEVIAWTIGPRIKKVRVPSMTELTVTVRGVRGEGDALELGPESPPSDPFYVIYAQQASAAAIAGMLRGLWLYDDCP